MLKLCQISTFKYICILDKLTYNRSTQISRPDAVCPSDKVHTTFWPRIDRTKVLLFISEIGFIVLVSDVIEALNPKLVGEYRYEVESRIDFDRLQQRVSTVPGTIEIALHKLHLQFKYHVLFRSNTSSPSSHATRAKVSYSYVVVRYFGVRKSCLSSMAIVVDSGS